MITYILKSNRDRTSDSNSNGLFEESKKVDSPLNIEFRGDGLPAALEDGTKISNLAVQKLGRLSGSSKSAKVEVQVLASDAPSGRESAGYRALVLFRDGIHSVMVDKFDSNPLKAVRIALSAISKQLRRAKRIRASARFRTVDSRHGHQIFAA